MRLARIALLLTAIIAVGWFGIGQKTSAVQASIRIADLVDQRPAERILFVGNSRTYQNDMPYLVRKIADSAGSPVRYDITVRGFGGASMELHWKDRLTRDVIAQENWDRVIIQAESRAHAAPDKRESFITYGGLLVRATRTDHAALLVNWAYDPKLYEGSPPEARADYFAAIQSDHRRLASDTGAALINAGLVWEDARGAGLPFALTRDGNHPTIQGSYLAALVVYASLPDADLGKVTYVPGGMTNSDGAQLRAIVRDSIRSRSL